GLAHLHLCLEDDELDLASKRILVEVLLDVGGQRRRPRAVWVLVESGGHFEARPRLEENFLLELIARSLFDHPPSLRRQDLENLMSRWYQCVYNRGMVVG